MERERVAIFVGGKLENIRGDWTMPGGVLDNAAFDVVAFISNVERVYGEVIWKGLKVVSCESITKDDFDDIIIMATEYESYIKEVREKLNEIYGINKDHMIASMFVKRIPEIGNLGGISFNESVPKGKYVNLKYLMRNGLISGTNDLEKFFLEKSHLLIDKWTHYFEVYEREFSRFRGKKIRMLEIGVFEGGSLQMWSDYFGSKAEIIGVDINPRCKEFETGNIKVEIGSQEDFGFLNYLKDKYGEFDIILDDGGHTMRQQNISFHTLFPAVKNGGVYLCEDCHTSYMEPWGGGYRRDTTFWELAKNLTDGLNDQFIKSDDYMPETESSSVKSVRFYNSIVVFEKEKMGDTLRLAWENNT